MEYKRIFSDGINLLGGKVGSSIISIVNIMILTRLLSPGEMGIYSLFIMVANLALAVGLSWSDGALVRFGREEFLETDKRSINEAFWIKALMFAIGSMTFSFGFLFFSENVSDYIGIQRWQIVLLIGTFFINGLVSFLGAVFRSIDRMKYAAYVLTLQRVLYLGCLSCLYLFGVSDKTLIFSALNISYFAALLYFMKYFDPRFISNFRFNKKKFKKMWVFAWPVLIGSSGIYVINYADLFVIRMYFDNSEVGVYSVAYSGFMAICGIIMLMQTLFMPLLVEYKHKGRFDLIVRYMNSLLLFALLWGAIAALGISISGFAIPLLFTENYQTSIHSFNILLVASFFHFCTTSLMPVVSAFELMVYYQGINIVRALVNVVADFALVPVMGIEGAAYATLLSFVVGFILTGILIMQYRDKIYGRSC